MEIEHGYVEHLIKYSCNPYYKLSGSGDGEACVMGTAPMLVWAPGDVWGCPMLNGAAPTTLLRGMSGYIPLCLPGCRAGMWTLISLHRHVQV